MSLTPIVTDPFAPNCALERSSPVLGLPPANYVLSDVHNAWDRNPSTIVAFNLSAPPAGSRRHHGCICYVQTVAGALVQIYAGVLSASAQSALLGAAATAGTAYYAIVYWGTRTIAARGSRIFTSSPSQFTINLLTMN